MSPALCRARLAPLGVAVHDAPAGLSAGHGSAVRHQGRASLAGPVRRPGGAGFGRGGRACAAGPRCAAPLSALGRTVSRIRTAPTGPTTRSALPPSPSRPPRLGGRLPDGDAPDVVHAHDWQAALAPVYLRFARADQARRRPATILTIHNLAFQGQFPASLLDAAALAAGSLHHRRRRVLRPDRISERRLGARRPHHHRLADLRDRDPRQRDGDGAGGPAAPSLPGPERDPEWHRYRGLESRDRPASRRAIRCAAP